MLLPSKLWLKAAKTREEALRSRNLQMDRRYNQTAHTLSTIPIGTNVLIQTPPDNKWTRSGVIVEVGNNRKYNIRMDGSSRVLSRNRRFIKPYNTDVTTPDFPSSETGFDIPQNSSGTRFDNQGDCRGSKVPQMWKRLLPYNSRGLKEC